jgi:ATP-binding cassette subfamily B protein
VVALSMYLSQFFEPISMLAQRYTLLQSALSGAERVFGLLAVTERDAPTIPERDGSHGSPEFAVELSSVTFGYKPDLDVLHNVSLCARQGETIALVGPTGSGKTTITSLLLRLYEIRSGAVRLLGRDVRTLERGELRQHFSVVPQDVFLFTGTLAENVAAGEEPDLERVRRVFEQMEALDWFEARPGGLLTPVAPLGANFSAGEKQMIAFARALYRDAKILILDEATASIDSDTEARLQRAQAALTRGRTSIVVAHRLSTVRTADRILVLRKGQVVEEGSHDQLLRQGGLYAALHRLQFKAQNEAPPSPDASGADITTRT